MIVRFDDIAGIVDHHCLSWVFFIMLKSTEHFLQTCLDLL